ncbi:MAG: C39 family peptidase [Patescibacteria group bacterium]
MNKRYLIIIPILFLGAVIFGLAKVSEEMALRRAPGGEADVQADNPGNGAIETNDGQIDLQDCAPEMPNVIPGREVNSGNLNPVEAVSPGAGSSGAKPADTPEPQITKTILLDVPFTSQAPFGDWKDERQQDGCEEASVIMAMLWTRGQTGITKDYALSKIHEISAFEEKNYDTFHDTGAKETLERIINDYFKYDKAEVKYDITLNGLKAELAKGNLIIVPANGRDLKNPNYTAPGPERHMLVVKGYDPKTREFITNDPGTRSGENFRYEENLFYNAIRDYLCGYHVPITEIHKNIIVVKK